jgi:hypothetical protein
MQPSAELKHAEGTGNERDVFLRGNGQRFSLRLFAAYKDDGPNFGDLRSSDYLWIGQASEQDSLGLAGGKHIAHQICPAAAANLDVGTDFRIQYRPVHKLNNFAQIHKKFPSNISLKGVQMAPEGHEFTFLFPCSNIISPALHKSQRRLS